MVVAAVAIVLAIVLWLAPEGEPFAIIRFVFQCVGLAAMITGCVLFFVAAARGMVFPSPLPGCGRSPGGTGSWSGELRSGAPSPRPARRTSSGSRPGGSSC